MAVDSSRPDAISAVSNFSRVSDLLVLALCEVGLLNRLEFLVPHEVTVVWVPSCLVITLAILVLGVDDLDISLVVVVGEGVRAILLVVLVAL